MNKGNLDMENVTPCFKNVKQRAFIKIMTDDLFGIFLGLV